MSFFKKLRRVVSTPVRVVKNVAKGKPKQAFNEIKSVPKQIKNTGNSLKDTIKREVLDEIKEELSKVDDRLEDLAETVVGEIVSKILSEAFKLYVKWLKVIRPDSAGLSISVFSFDFDVTNEKIKYLEGLIKRPPKHKNDIKHLLLFLKPDQVTISADAQIALGVGTNAVGVGGRLTWDTDKLIRRFDEIL